MLATPLACVVLVEDNTRDALEACAARLKSYPVVVGLGGGLAMDAAKYVARANGQILIQVPSAASNNACFTRTAWYTSDGLRQPARDCPIPDAIVVDPKLIAAAPPRMNRAGLAEILCSHTALFDWRLGRDAGRDVAWDDAILAFTEGELSAIDDLAAKVAADDIGGFLAIIEACARFAPHFTTHPRARFNACSEHLFAWALEQCAGRRILHGDAVSLGILVMSSMQENAPERAADIIEAARLPAHPCDIGLTWDEVRAAVRMMPAIAKAMSWHSIIDVLGATGDVTEVLLERLQDAETFMDARRRQRRASGAD